MLKSYSGVRRWFFRLEYLKNRKADFSAIRWLLELVVLYKSANFGDRMKSPKGAKGGQRSNFGL